ncbi:protein SMG8 [Marchantia polymorpha subsp. ruderalis]|uniref:Nonsense-mediated mRNA decay factor SMG8 n=2 Tax=Marchantia polymorpha TaxID=3197 RepID=A0AAF6B927_MARPO|nr:hypothetical protein MARPO_0011s0199 [Marchantia polymorpha]PTQ46546.1 hypothetical protein MARPO_0011s0199 [Marchantia polymorpha]BBN08511.1 hypothetical protein Mp_4g12170 [Marchantia polymorpha subsp. ruderalis]BBN08512.1 hypothetical protein Mp_4g12170 [Marchantia polymorpha subsp. ruderalis]|eukprot:PTQ46545.1 hypothetical protein MARPO_0011s0199 [Marchantia polymorpha]
MSVRMLSRPPSTNANSSNAGIPVSLAPPASILNSTASSPPSFAPSSSSGSPPSPSPFSFPAPPDLSFQQQRSSLSSPPPSPAGGSSVLNFSPPVQPSSSSASLSVASSGSGAGCVPASPLSSLGTNGVVVVGVIGRVEHEVSQLLDRLLDAQVFGSRHGGSEPWSEAEDSVHVHSGNSFHLEKELGKDGTSQVLCNRARDRDPREVANSDAESRAEDSSVTSAGFIDEKHDFKARGFRTEQLWNGDSGRQKEKRADEKLGKGPVGNGNNERKKESQCEDKVGRFDEAKGCDGLRDACKSSPGLLSKLKHYHDEEKGMVYVQFTWGSPPLDMFREESYTAALAPDGLSATLEHHEADGMRGLLFMFSVCHVVLLVQDGAHFDPRFLRMLRLLQTAKHSLAPFVKTQVLPGLLPPPSSSITRPSPLKPISLATTNSTSGRTGVVGRSSSTIALMSGSTPVLFPGQCTPVVLFVFLEDLTEPSMGGVSCPSGARTEDISEALISTVSPSGSLSQSMSVNYLTRQSAHTKPAPVTVARTNNKSEAGFRKKLQSSMEAQIRFLLKKCRTVAGSGESGPSGVGGGPGMGPRGPGGSANSFQGVGGGGALFLLDPSRAVVILDRSSNRVTDALDAATDAIDAMLLGKEGAEDALWEVGLSAGVGGEDVQAVKDFLWRQADILRGKGGITSNAAGGSAGVGMVAAAAAAAAASAASGGSAGSNKPICNPPELPSITSWLSACRVLAEALSVRVTEDGGGHAGHKASGGNRTVMKKGSVAVTRISAGTGTVVRSKGTIDSTICSLESGANMDQKFSAAWCKRVLPSAHEVYMKGLPPCYPTSLHKSQLEKALAVFRAMVRGPAVPIYVETLKRDCEAVWQSGRQLCDAESLTGKPCIHQVHEVNDSLSSNSNLARRKGRNESQEAGKSAFDKRIFKPHSSGVMFLHACACGRSRKLRKDPFDFESANVSFFKFPNCEDLLPSLVIPSPEGCAPFGGSPWSLVCLGNSRYYQPSTGLVQGGFCAKQNYLSTWVIPIVYRKAEADEEIHPPSPPKEQVAESLPFPRSKAAVDGKIMIKALLPRAQPILESKSASANLYSKVAEKGYSESSRTNSTRAGGVPDLPRSFTDIATKANYGGESAFPPLPQKQDKLAPPPARTSKHSNSKERKDTSHVVREHREENCKALVNEVPDKLNDRLDTPVGFEEQTVSNGKGPADLSSKLSPNSVTEHIRIYIGFEHECPHGHRFLLSNDQAENSSSSIPTVLPGTGKSEYANAGRPSRSKKPDPNEVPLKESVQLTRTLDMQSVSLQESNGKSSGPMSLFKSNRDRKEMKVPDDMQYWSVQDGHGDGHSLLNSNLPIYMNCPYCKTSEEGTKSTTKSLVLGGTISQLQRIFVVTPSLPLLLATCPLVEFEDVSKPVKTVMEFNLGSEVVLPPDSFLSLRLPFVYYSQMDGVPIKPLLVKQHKPEQTGWLVKGTALYLKSKGGVNGPFDG